MKPALLFSLLFFHLIFCSSVEGLSWRYPVADSLASSPTAPVRPASSLGFTLGALFPLLLALRSSSSSVVSFAKAKLSRALRSKPVTPSSSPSSNPCHRPSACSPPSTHPCGASKPILKKQDCVKGSSMSGRKTVARLTFASNSEHLVFNRDDPPLELCKSMESVILTPTEAETPESGYFSASSGLQGEDSLSSSVEQGTHGAANSQGDQNNGEHRKDHDKSATQNNAEEEASSSSFGYEGFEADDFVYNEQKMLRWRLLQCGEDSGTDSEAESEASEGGDDSCYLGSQSQSASVVWEFFKGTFDCDTVKTKKEHEIYSFEDFHIHWGKICSVSNLPKGSVVQFHKRIPDLKDRKIAGHWWISLKESEAGVLASVWSDILLTLMGFNETEDKGFLDNLLGAEFRVGLQHVHLLLAAHQLPVNIASDKASLKKGFQLDGGCELKFVGATK